LEVYLTDIDWQGPRELRKPMQKQSFPGVVPVRGQLGSLLPGAACGRLEQI